MVLKIEYKKDGKTMEYSKEISLQDMATFHTFEAIREDALEEISKDLDL